MHNLDEVLSLVRSLPAGDRERLRMELDLLAARESAVDFWHERNIEELATIQGVAVPSSVDEIFGKGTDLWQDADFNSFVSGIYERRREGNRD